MLLSKKAMKKVNMKPDMVNDKAGIYEQVVVLQNTSTVHYSVPLKEISVHIKDYFIVIEANENIVRVITKLHKKLCTPLQMVERGWWVMLIFLFQHADELAATCSICFKFKKTPARPVVGLPLATQFNEYVFMDLKEWGQVKWIFHLIVAET